MGKKYFIVVDGEQKGPFTLEQLPGEGVTPDTYVWSKGMADWEQASKDADICRYYRQRLAGLNAVPAVAETSAGGDNDREEQSGVLHAPEQAPEDERPMSGRQQLNRIMQEVNRAYEEQVEARKEEMLQNPPQRHLLLAILGTVLFFPPTGLFAIYLHAKASKEWKKGEAENNGDLKLEAHNTARRARMLTGITFCLGIIVWAAVCRLV